MILVGCSSVCDMSLHEPRGLGSSSASLKTISHTLLSFLVTPPLAMSQPVFAAAGDLVLYKVVPKAEKDVIDAAGCLQVPPGEWHVGLRERLEDAVERERIFTPHVSKHTHLVLQVRFSPQGVALFTTRCAGEDYKFGSTLCKKSYGSKTWDYKVWHFVTDLPLTASDSEGNLLVSCDWREIE